MSDLDTRWDASQLRARIAASGIKMKWLASKLAVSDGTLTNWTRGRTEPTASALIRIAELTECRVADLLPREGE